ncbi:MAG: hypothetical protein ABI874_10765 [Chloroflexota bacterium]
MRRVFIVVCLLALHASASAHAAPLQQDCSGVAITSPRESGDPVRGRVNLSGSAFIPQFQFYKVEFAAGNNPADTSFRNMAADVHRSSVQSGLLDVWDTTGLSDGPYTLRLTVVDIRGNFPCPPIVVHSIIVANRAPTPTATAALIATPTVDPNAPTPGPSPTRPSVPTIVLPTITARTTVTPTPVANDNSAPRASAGISLLPDAIEGLAWGVCGMVALLVIAGVYIAVRAILDRI